MVDRYRSSNSMDDSDSWGGYLNNAIKSRIAMLIVSAFLGTAGGLSIIDSNKNKEDRIYTKINTIEKRLGNIEREQAVLKYSVEIIKNTQSDNTSELRSLRKELQNQRYHGGS